MILLIHPAITNGQIKNIINKGVSPNKISYLPDWIDIDFFKDNLNKYRKNKQYLGL